MYIAMHEGRVMAAGEYPMPPMDNVNIPYTIVDIPNRHMEDILQHVARPKMLQDEMQTIRDNNGIAQLTDEPLTLMNFLLSGIAITQYIYDLEFTFVNIEPDPELYRNYKNWNNITLSLLGMAEPEELKPIANKIHTEIIHWQRIISQGKMHNGIKPLKVELSTKEVLVINLITNEISNSSK